MDNPNLKNSCGWVCEQVCESECMCVDIYIELDGHASFCEQAIHFFPHWLYHHFCDETQLSCFFKYLSYGDMVEYHIKVKRVGGGTKMDSLSLLSYISLLFWFSSMWPVLALDLVKNGLSAERNILEGPAYALFKCISFQR